MSLVPRRARGPEDERDPTTLVEGIYEEAREEALHANSARWRAGALAEAIFGTGVIPRLRHARGARGFLALVELEVPFHCLDTHRERETRFIREAERDEILSRLPAVFVFTPAESRG